MPVINLSKDPKGFYVALGVDETASADDIKAAFRHKAKKLHPDHNPSPIAAKQFHRVHEAYETLTDPLKRAAYDRGWRTVGGGAKAAESERPRQEPPKPGSGKTEPPKAEPFKAERPRTAEPPPATEAKASAAEQPAVCKCGTVTAQPRYIIFDMVWGRGSKVLRRGIGGVYCRSCADRAAIRSSMVNWIAGWWAVPDGPRETVRAIVSNMRGGRRPAERNARLLVRQARAFRARGDMELARGCAEQALSFASNAGLRREIDSLLVSLSSFPARALKDRWAQPGAAPMIQALPLAIIVGGLAMTLVLSSPTPITVAVSNAVRSWTQPAAPEPVATPPAPSGQVYSVAAASTALRTGPGTNYQVVRSLSAGVVIMVVETDPSGAWARVVLEDHTVGFVATGDLSTQVSVEALSAFGNARRQPP